MPSNRGSAGIRDAPVLASSRRNEVRVHVSPQTKRKLDLLRLMRGVTFREATEAAFTRFFDDPEAMAAVSRVRSDAALLRTLSEDIDASAEPQSHEEVDLWPFLTEQERVDVEHLTRARAAVLARTAARRNKARMEARES